MEHTYMDILMNNLKTTINKLIILKAVGCVLAASMSMPVLALSNTNSFDDTSIIVEGQHSYALKSAADQLMPHGWDISFARNQYRDVIVRFTTNGKYKPRWSEILEDAAKRHGIALLISTEKKQVIAVPADEFKQAGLHFVKTNRLLDQNRYEWNHWVESAAIENGKYELLLAENKIKAKMNQSEQNQKFVNNSINKVKNEYALKQVVLRKKEHELAGAITKAEYQEKLLLASTKEKSAAEKNYNAEAALLRQTQITTLALQRQAKRDQEIQAANDKAKLQRNIEANNEMLARNLKVNKQKHDQAIAKVINTQQKLDKDVVEFQTNKHKFYPESDRHMAMGEGEAVVKAFFSDNWKYGVVWDASLLTADQQSSLQFDYQMNFSGESLASDVSQISCALTRDVSGIIVAAELRTVSRVVYLQFHRSSEEIRNQLLAECYN